MGDERITLLGRHRGGVTRVLAVGDRVYSAGMDHRILSLSATASPLEIIRFAPVQLFPHEPKSKPYAAWFDLRDGLLACAMKHGVVELYEIESAKHLRSLKNPEVGKAYALDFDSVAFSPDGGQVVGSNGRYAVAWDVTSGDMIWQDTMGSRINSVAFLRGGKFLLLQEWDPLPRIVAWPGGKRTKYQFEMVEGSWNLVNSRACPKKGKVDFAISAVDADGGYLLGMKLEEESPVFEFHAPCRLHDLDFLPDGRRVAAGGDDGILRIFDIENKAIEEIRLDEVKEVVALPEESDESSPGILCTKDVEEGGYSPRAIHAISAHQSGKWIAVGLVGGLVLRVDLDE